MERLLAALLVRADHLVSTEQLFGEMWDDEPPRRATAGLHVCVSQLRKLLRRSGRATSVIVTRPAGYLLRLNSDGLDVHEFLQVAAQGRQHAQAGRCGDAAACFERALSLWRGPVLGDLPQGPIIQGYATWLDEERLECVEQLIEMRLVLGQHRGVVGQLYSLTAEHPLRETLFRQLMLALYRSERQADALKVYQSVQRTLQRELGVEPCRSLQAIRHAILAGDRRLHLMTTWDSADDGSAA